MAMCIDMGEKVEGSVLGDASAALAIIHRKGLGKLRHLDTNYLWVQEVAARKQIAYKKVHGKENVADLFTKPVSWEEICKHVEKMRGEFSLEWLGVNSDRKMENSIFELAKTGNWMGKYICWQRTDLNTKTAKTSMRGGPIWDQVRARITADIHTGDILRCEMAQAITRNVEHVLLEGGPRDVRITLFYQSL